MKVNYNIIGMIIFFVLLGFASSCSGGGEPFGKVLSDAKALPIKEILSELIGSRHLRLRVQGSRFKITTDGHYS